uniref:Uncharacterized protein n=1 Tax=Streptomyces avermitilis TaxID=33903 RepID=A0A499VQP5_STRAX|nr:hypothetical protein SAVMC3_13260 [Streptomyces avermitilis]
MEAIPARHGIVAAARVAADPPRKADVAGMDRADGTAVKALTDMSLPGVWHAQVRRAKGGSGVVGSARTAVPGAELRSRYGRPGHGRRTGTAGSAQSAGRAADTQQIDVTAGGQVERRPTCAVHTVDDRLQAPHASLPIH